MIALLSFVALCGTCAAKEWHWSSPRTRSFFAISHGPDRFVAVGQFGVILWSTNGEHWYAATSPVTGYHAELYGVCYGNGMHVAVGKKDNMANILRSTDGKAWQTCVSPTFEELNDVSFGNGKFVAVGKDATILVSTDGITWTVGSHNESAGWPYPLSSLGAVQYGNGVWVALEENQTGGIRSLDGINWDRIYTGVGYEKELIFDGSKFVTVSGGGSGSAVSSSTDGITWTTTAAPESLYGLAYGEGRYIALRGGLIYASTDLTTWTPVSDAPPGFNSVCYGDGVFTGVGIGRAFSEDGLNWQGEMEAGPSINLNGTCYFKGLHLVVGDSGFLGYYRFEPDGFVQVASGTNWDLTDMACSSSAVVAVGAGGMALRSTDGVSWTRVDAKTASNLNKIIYWKGQFCAVGDSGAVTISGDGQTWTKVVTGTTENLMSIAGGDSTAVVGTWNGNLLLSANLQTWAKRAGPGEVLWDIAYGNGVFAGMGWFGNTWRSADGLTWQSSPSGHVGWLSRVTFGDGQFVLATEDGYLRTSVDGITWRHTGLALEGWGRINALSFNGERFFGVGNHLYGNDQPAVVYSQRRPDLRKVQTFLEQGPDETLNLHLKIGAEMVDLFDVEASHDLITWEVVAKDRSPRSPRSAGWLYAAPLSTSAPRRFFRLKNAP
ncbi:MAG TPA: hypothetical protein VF585_03030 [Chthoniobacterales bacterium]